MFVIGKFGIGDINQRQLRNYMYLTLAEIKAARGVEGDLCTCVENETVYKYVENSSSVPDDAGTLITGDGGNSRWIAYSGRFAVYKTKIAVTGTIAASTPFSTATGGVNYTTTGAAINLGADAAEFNGNNILTINLNGVEQEKGSDVSYLTANTFTLAQDVNNADEIVILKSV